MYIGVAVRSLLAKQELCGDLPTLDMKPQAPVETLLFIRDEQRVESLCGLSIGGRFCEQSLVRKRWTNPSSAHERRAAAT